MACSVISLISIALRSLIPMSCSIKSKLKVDFETTGFLFNFQQFTVYVDFLRFRTRHQFHLLRLQFKVFIFLDRTLICLDLA